MGVFPQESRLFYVAFIGGTRALLWLVAFVSPAVFGFGAFEVIYVFHDNSFK